MNTEPAIVAIDGEIFTIQRQATTVKEELSKLYGEIKQKELAVKYRNDRLAKMVESLDALNAAKRLLEAVNPEENQCC